MLIVDDLGFIIVGGVMGVTPYGSLAIMGLSSIALYMSSVASRGAVRIYLEEAIFGYACVAIPLGVKKAIYTNSIKTYDYVNKNHYHFFVDKALDEVNTGRSCSEFASKTFVEVYEERSRLDLKTLYRLSYEDDKLLDVFGDNMGGHLYGRVIYKSTPCPNLKALEEKINGDCKAQNYICQLEILETILEGLSDISSVVLIYEVISEVYSYVEEQDLYFFDYVGQQSLDILGALITL